MLIRIFIILIVHPRIYYDIMQ